MPLSEAAIAQDIMRLTSDRGMGKTICPSEVARHISPSDWRPLMPQIRAAARRLQQQGLIRVTQAGRDVNPMDAHGPIRLGLPPA